MAIKKFLISNSAALALGIAGTLIAGGYTARASVPMKLSATAENVLAAPEGVTFDGLLKKQLCPSIEPKLGMVPGTCEASMFYAGGTWGRVMILREVPAEPAVEDDPETPGDKGAAAIPEVPAVWGWQLKANSVDSDGAWTRGE